MRKTGMEAVRDVMPMAALARQLGVSRGAIAQWDRVPEGRLEDVARITGISPSRLRPDLASLFEKERRQRASKEGAAA